MRARERGAKIIHVDPRFGRTGASADLHVAIRSGTDIAFLGGIIRHVLETESYFKDYVLHYTNASTIISEEFADTEDLGGVFSGFDPETGTYDRSTWMYEGGEVAAAAGMREHASQAFTESTGVGLLEGAVKRDETLQHERCVLQLLRKHYARYTPQMVAQICGIPERQFHEVANALIENSGRERTTALVYAVGWTQQSLGVQISCCWETSGAPAAGSWRCAATRRSRARATFRRSMTCSPDTCRCRAHVPSSCR
jgi:formate dehydrogenase major subunit